MKLFEVTVAVAALLAPQNSNGAASFQQHSPGEPATCSSEDAAAVEPDRSLPTAPHSAGQGRAGVESASDSRP